MDHDASGEGIVIVYSNFFQVGQNAVEFLLDFGRQFDESGVRMLTRVITNPAHAKVFSQLLNQAIADYEERFGSIEDLAG